MSTTSAASIAISVPAPMAMPISALVSAGASLIPSPTMATFPFRFSDRITLSLPSGRTPAITSSTPAWAPIAFAVRSLSPVSITTWIPIFCNSFTACGLSSLITSATAIMPASFPFLLKNSGVFPCSASSSAFCLVSPEISAFRIINLRFPPQTVSPPMFPDRPFPATARKSSASVLLSTPFSSAFARIARASGCSLFFSKVYARLKSSSSVTPSAGIISVTFGSPLVIVPVLSSATICVLPVSSRETAVLNIIPFFAPIPFPTMIATGVASPSAHGQLITSTEIPLASANPTVCPAISHTMIVIRAIAITAGTKTPDTLSATFAIGAFVAAASLTIWIIWERVVSSPTRVASQRRKPDWLRVAAETASPFFLSTGILSPVNADSFTALVPSTTIPSTGIFSPGLTTKISPFLT